MALDNSLTAAKLPQHCRKHEPDDHRNDERNGVARSRSEFPHHYSKACQTQTADCSASRVQRSRSESPERPADPCPLSTLALVLLYQRDSGREDSGERQEESTERWTIPLTQQA